MYMYRTIYNWFKKGTKSEQNAFFDFNEKRRKRFTSVKCITNSFEIDHSHSLYTYFIIETPCIHTYTFRFYDYNYIYLSNDGSHPSSPIAHRSRWLESNNRELILLFWKLSRRRVPLLRAAAPFHAFIRGADSLPPLLCLIIRFFPLFHFAEREREREVGRAKGDKAGRARSSTNPPSSSSSSARSSLPPK